MKSIKNYTELKSNLSLTEKTYLLLYKNGSEISDCALKNITKVSKGISGITFLKSDVSQVKDIHGKYKISSVPSLLYFEKGKFINVIKGCHEESFFNLHFTNNVAVVKKKVEAAQKRVIVYSTPSCSWCTKIKNYFKEKNIRYTDVDVSKDQRKMDELVKKSGQMGVPQTEIGSTIVVGFDKAKINKLLNIFR
ncbi:MAG: thioredoxin family protein [Candidatus Delongbacteria bacterium]|nr:thioredoxin family protein [Candidatus Delongbacteria bacterium]